MSLTLGQEGGAAFLRSVPFNFASILALFLAMLLAAGMLPETGLLKEAVHRVGEGGSLWPQGSEKYFLAKDENEVYGNPVNLLLPLFVMVLVSVISGVRKAGGIFALDAAAGLAAALVVMFVLYIGQRLMTPLKFMDYVVEGISSMALPIFLLLLTLCFSTCLDSMECTRFFARLIPSLSLRKPFLLPAVLYLVFSLLTMIMGSSWGMYGIGIPIAIRLALLADLPMALCLGAVCAAGITGDNLCPYVAEGSLIASAVGCDPKVNRDIRIRYWSVIALICTAAYLLAGVLSI
jgi:Na+/H+ antiporter NhaC